MRLIFAAIAVASTLLTGCAASPERLALMDEINRTIPSCKSQQECEVKWSAARQWVLANSGWKLQQVQPDFMETYNPVGASTDIAVRVVKEVRQNGETLIKARIWCGNMFGCIPDPAEALKNFQDFVSASWKG